MDAFAKSFLGNVAKVERPKLASEIQGLKATPHWLVQSDGRGYWGRGASVLDAITNAEWFQAGDKVIVCKTDPGAYVNDDGAITYYARSAVYRGVINKVWNDVIISEPEIAPANAPFGKDNGVTN